MRKILGPLGIATIVAYSFYGAMLANDWAVTAASGLPLPETIARMHSSGQPYDSLAGYLFAAGGIIFATLWGCVTMIPSINMPKLAAIGTWALIMVGGMPAYWFASFGNMMSVGDTFENWNAGAAHAAAMPLYFTSGVALLVGSATLILALLAMIREARAIRKAAATP